MKSGMAVYLHQSPQLRGNISRVEKDGFWVTWHKFVTDVPESLKAKVNVSEASKRMRVFYRWHEAKNVGIGVPA